MKKNALLVTALMICSFANAQFQFSDDFESYSSGDYICQESDVWTTWSGTDGGSEDIQVTLSDTPETSNTIHLEGTASGGGPVDIIADFGAVFTSGDFVFESDLYVAQSAGAYFNFQAESEIGVTWAMECTMTNGVISFLSSSTEIFSGVYPQADWFTITMEIDLTTNNWEAFINGESIGTFSNSINQVASLNLFPSEGSDFYVDNVSLSHTPFVLPNLNGAMLSLNPIDGLISQERYPIVEVKNLGAENITSFDVVLDFNSSQVTESIVGVNMSSYESMLVEFTSPIVLNQELELLTATITAINGSLVQDDILTDDSKTIEVTALKPADGKIVIAEEGTGTWCGWCPRGTVAMDFMARDFKGYYQGIAVHNGDPMAVPAYDQDLQVSGYPSALVDRGTEIDPSDIKGDFMERILLPPTAIITNGAQQEGDSLHVSLTVNFTSPANGNWKIACVLTEDGVSGTSGSYAQSNSYSGGASGDLIGLDGVNWADLSSSVSASMMVYDHVARAIMPSFDGFAGFPNSIQAGNSFTFNFKFGMGANWKTEDMHIVGMLMDSSGSIDNGSSSTLESAISNGFTSGENVLATSALSHVDAVLNVYPNPTSDYLQVSLNIKETSDLQFNIFNTAGQLVANHKYENVIGSQALPLNVSGFTNGLYTLELIMNDAVVTKQFLKH